MDSKFAIHFFIKNNYYFFSNALIFVIFNYIKVKQLNALYMERKLMKSDDSRLCGVCGGIAEYLGIDPTVVRVLTAIAALCTGGVFIIFAYLIAAMVMPSN